MPKYECFSTRWDDVHVVEELIPAKGLEFSMPLSDHGECSFSATSEPGRSFWRPAIMPIISGLLIARDDVPVWQGWVYGERQTGARTFSFQAAEWGSFFERVPAVGLPGGAPFKQWDDHELFRTLISLATATSGQDPRIDLGTNPSAYASDLTIDPWADARVERMFREHAARGGPEWYFGSGGTMADPVRQLILGNPLGHTTPQTTLEYVEDSETWQQPSGPPMITLLGDLFPGGTQVPAVRRRGGNVIAPPMRTRDSGSSATQVIALGAGQEKAQKRIVLPATGLLTRGWPRLTKTVTHQDVSDGATLGRHAQADLAAAAGITTGYSLVTLDGDPDWTQTPRGSQVRVRLDTDVYGAERPVGGDEGFVTRLLNTTVRVADDGPAQIQWDVATVLDDLI